MSSLEDLVGKDTERNPEAKCVNIGVFVSVNHKIHQLLDAEILFPKLLERGLVSNEEEVERLRSSFEQPHDHYGALIDLASRGGDRGFQLLYILICDTVDSAPGHSEAAMIISEEGTIAKAVAFRLKGSHGIGMITSSVAC